MKRLIQQVALFFGVAQVETGASVPAIEDQSLQEAYDNEHLPPGWEDEEPAQYFDRMESIALGDGLPIDEEKEKDRDFYRQFGYLFPAGDYSQDGELMKQYQESIDHSVGVYEDRVCIPREY